MLFIMLGMSIGILSCLGLLAVQHEMYLKIMTGLEEALVTFYKLRKPGKRMNDSVYVGTAYFEDCPGVRSRYAEAIEDGRILLGKPEVPEGCRLLINRDRRYILECPKEPEGSKKKPRLKTRVRSGVTIILRDEDKDCVAHILPVKSGQTKTVLRGITSKEVFLKTAEEECLIPDEPFRITVYDKRKRTPEKLLETKKNLESYREDYLDDCLTYLRKRLNALCKEHGMEYSAGRGRISITMSVPLRADPENTGTGTAPSAMTLDLDDMFSREHVHTADNGYKLWNASVTYEEYCKRYLWNVAEDFMPRIRRAYDDLKKLYEEAESLKSECLGMDGYMLELLD